MPNKYLFYSPSKDHVSKTEHWLVTVWHSRVLVHSLCPDQRRITILINLSHPEAAHNITREGSLMEVCNVLYTFHLALKQVKQTGGWCDSDFCISWMGCCIAKPGPGAQSFQKKNYLNCPTTTVVPKTVFQNCEKPDKDEAKDIQGLRDKKVLFGRAERLQEVPRVHKGWERWGKMEFFQSQASDFPCYYLLWF